MEQKKNNNEGECRLCQKLRRLQRSHFLPAAMYKNLNPGDNRHVIVNKEKYFSTSRQAAAHLLCRECEQKFSRNGEQWVLENGFRGQGNFRLQSLLRNSRPLGKTRSSVYFAGVELPEVNMDQLCYFGASVFWRGSAHRWDRGDFIDLGPIYTEEFRRFLIGEIEFPANAILQIHVSNADRPMEGAFFPSGGRIPQVHVYASWDALHAGVGRSNTAEPKIAVRRPFGEALDLSILQG